MLQTKDFLSRNELQKQARKPIKRLRMSKTKEWREKEDFVHEKGNEARGESHA